MFGPRQMVEPNSLSAASSRAAEFIGCCQVDDVSTNIGSSSAMMTTSKSIDRGYRFPADVIEQAVWLSIRFPQPQDGRGPAGGARDYCQP